MNPFEKIFERLEERTDFLSDCTKYGNKDTKQQEKSYSTMMFYEVADLVDDLKEIVKEVAEEYNDGWIPCSDRHPEEYGEYLIWWTDITGKQYYEITEYEPDNGWIGDIPQAVEGIYNVIAWQQLPEPYNQKGDRES